MPDSVENVHCLFLGVDTEPASCILLQPLLEVRQDTDDQGRTSLTWMLFQKMLLKKGKKTKLQKHVSWNGVFSKTHTPAYAPLDPTVGLMGKSAELYGTFYI